MTIKNSESFVSYDHSGVTFFVSCEREMVHSVQAFRLPALEYEGHPKEEVFDGDLSSESILDPFRFFVGVSSSDKGFCIGICDNVNRLLLLLEWFDNVVEKRLSVRNGAITSSPAGQTAIQYAAL